MALSSKKRLSPKSEYEQTFQTRHRGPGRPAAMEDGSVLFPAQNEDPVLVKVAQRRAFAVVHEQQRERLHSLYLDELAVLKRRGVAEVAEDSGIDISSRFEDDSEEAA